MDLINNFFSIELTDCIDLHHFHPADIKYILDEFLTNAQQKGYEKVEIIHGKGKSVNKMIVYSFLEKDTRIEQFFDKPGNWGCTIAIIKKRRPI